MKNNAFFKENVVPALVLVIICLVVTAALAFTYGVASPIIAENEKATADAARAQVLAEGDGFTLYEGQLVDGVTECYTADNGAGIAVTSTYGSFGGTLTAMVGIDKDGNPSYKKKNFSGIKGDATPEALVTVADAIKLVLANQTRDTLVNEISALEANA